MKKSLLLSIAIAAFISSPSAFAEDKAEDHSAHHPEEKTTTAPADKPGMPGMGGGMGSMKMDEMMGMMSQCKEMHKDGKMCDQEMMQKCETNMKKGECQKMMKQAKVQEKKSNPKK